MLPYGVSFARQGTFIWHCYLSPRYSPWRVISLAGTRQLCLSLIRFYGCLKYRLMGSSWYITCSISVHPLIFMLLQFRKKNRTINNKLVLKPISLKYNRSFHSSEICTFRNGQNRKVKTIFSSKNTINCHSTGKHWKIFFTTETEVVTLLNVEYYAYTDVENSRNLRNVRVLRVVRDIWFESKKINKLCRT